MQLPYLLIRAGASSGGGRKEGGKKNLRFFLCQLLFDELHERIDCHLVVPALRYNQVGIAFARLYKLLVHRFEYALIAFHYGFGSTPALYYIAELTAMIPGAA